MLPGGAGSPLEQGKQIPESNPKAPAAWEDGLGSPVPRGKLGRHWAAWEGLGRAGNPLEQGKKSFPLPESNPKAAAAWGAGLGSQLPILDGCDGHTGGTGQPGGLAGPGTQGSIPPSVARQPLALLQLPGAAADVATSGGGGGEHPCPSLCLLLSHTSG